MADFIDYGGLPDDYTWYWNPILGLFEAVKSGHYKAMNPKKTTKKKGWYRMFESPPIRTM